MDEHYLPCSCVRQDARILLCKSPRVQAAGAARLAGFTARAGAQCPQSGRLCVEFSTFLFNTFAGCFANLSIAQSFYHVKRDASRLGVPFLLFLHIGLLVDEEIIFILYRMSHHALTAPVEEAELLEEMALER